ncbi:MAG: GAF domain-containing protein [Calditrichaeota bacterium]|nr:MAG: GAF domain-containing protein [Calditrichota bacterium]
MGEEKKLREEVKRLQQALHQKEREVYSIHRIGKALSSTLQLDELLRLIIQEITSLMNADRGTLYIVDHAAGEIWSKIALKAEIKEIRQKLGRGISGVVAQTGETINIPDAYEDDRFDPSTDKKTGYRTRSILCMPVWDPLSSREEGKIIGVIQLLNKKDGVFTEEDEALLEAMASQVAISIANSQLYHRLEKKFKEIDLLYEFEQMLNTLDDLPDILKQILGKTMKHLQAQRVLTIFPVEEGTLLAGMDVEDHFYFDKFSTTSPVVVELIKNPTAEFIRSLKEDLTGLFRADENFFPDEGNVLAAKFPVNDEEGVLIALDVKRGQIQRYEDEQKLMDLVGQKIARAYELNTLREQLLKRERLSAIGQLMSTIVHDLRGPVNTIYGFVDLLREESDENSREEYADIIRSEINAMMNMITEVLDFAKGKTSILPRKVNVVDILKQFKPRLEQICTKHNTQLTMDVKSRQLVYVDVEKINRVFYNITKNAMEAMGEGGSFTFKVYDEEDGVVFQFTDTGPGIPQEIQNRLFETFVTSGKESGTGLGLAIVKKIVDEHNGSIEIDSAPNQGATFRIRIPVYKNN